MLSGRKRNTLTGESLEGSVAKGCLQSCEDYLQMNSEGHRVGCYTLGYVLIAENSQIPSHSFFRRL